MSSANQSQGGDLKDFQGNQSPLNSEYQTGELNTGVVNVAQSGEVPIQPLEETPGGTSNQSPPQPVSQVPQAGSLPPSQPAGRSFGMVKFGLIALLVVALGVGGYFGYNYYLTRVAEDKTEEKAANTPTQSPQETPAPASETEENADEETSVTAESGSETVNFNECSPGDGYSRSVLFGSTYLSITDVDDKNALCVVEILNEVEGGYTKYSCKVPKSTGTVIFEVGSTGSDFSKIMSFCAESKSGNVLLE